MTKEVLVTTVTPEHEVPYGRLQVAFYDNPRTYTPKKSDESVTENRLYISINITNGKDHIKRKAKDHELRLYSTAYDKYLAAKKKGGTLDTVTNQAAEIEALKKQLAAKQEKAKKEVK